MFRVVPDQLRISEGWVRCGHCDEVFDANAHLKNLEEIVQSAQQDEAQVPLPPDPTPPLPPEPDPLADSVPVSEPEHVAQVTETETHALKAEEENEQAYDWGLDLPPTEPPAVEIDIALPMEPANAQQALDAAAERLYENVETNEVPQQFEESGPLEPFLDEVPATMQGTETPSLAQGVSESIDNWIHEKQVTASMSAVASDSLAAPQDDVPLSFMPKAGKPSWVGRWFSRWVLVAVSVMMAFALGGQFVWHQRDRLAANYPMLRGPLTAACAMASCTIAAPRQIDSIAIESSAFTNVRAGIYLLQVTLKNSASLDLAVPALELTLTDLQDRPLFRKVIRAEEIKAKTQVFAAGSELNAGVPIQVRDGDVSSVTGYKLLAFYP